MDSTKNRTNVEIIEECTPDRMGKTCPVTIALQEIGGVWKGVVVFHLLSGTKRFGELKKLLPGVTQRMLTLQLRELEKSGLVKRKVFREIPPKVEYSLTPFGKTLEPVITELMTWGRSLSSKKKSKSA